MYPLTPELTEFLLGEQAERELIKLADADLSDVLGLLTWLRRRYSQAEAAALLDQAILRRRAAPKFPESERMWFIEEALEQASSRAVATYRADFLVARGVQTVADLGCGLGADTIAMAEAGLHVIAVERDPVRARLAGANVAAAGLSDRVQVLCTDWTTLDFVGPLAVDAAFVDPARRVACKLGGRRRIFSLDAMVPPLPAIRMLRQQVPDVLAKVAPGLNLEEVPAEAAVIFVAEGTSLKEAILSFGALRPGAASCEEPVSDQPKCYEHTSLQHDSGEPGGSHRVDSRHGDAWPVGSRHAVVLPGPHTLTGDGNGRAPVLRQPQAVLYEPNPAVLRAGLVRELGEQLDAGQLHPDVAYLTGEAPVPTPFARAWPIERQGPFDLKVLNRWLCEAGAGRVVVKRRGSPIEPDAFRRRLKVRPDGPEKTVFLTRVDDRPWMVLGGTPLFTN